MTASAECHKQSPVWSMSTTNMPVGWYQDQKAELYYYEGENHWRYVDLETNKKLTKMATAGTLEFIG